MAKNYETDRNESNYAGKNYGESDSRNCGKTVPETAPEILLKTVPKTATATVTETKHPMNMILKRTENLTDTKYSGSLKQD